MRNNEPIQHTANQTPNIELQTTKSEYTWIEDQLPTELSTVFAFIGFEATIADAHQTKIPLFMASTKQNIAPLEASCIQNWTYILWSTSINIILMLSLELAISNEYTNYEHFRFNRYDDVYDMYTKYAQNGNAFVLAWLSYLELKVSFVLFGNDSNNYFTWLHHRTIQPIYGLWWSWNLCICI